MSFIIYEENPIRRSGAKFDFENADATKFYLEHFSNRKFLQFMLSNPASTFSEKQQANKELVICDRKLEYWRRHPRFNTALANSGILKINKEWER